MINTIEDHTRGLHLLESICTDYPLAINITWPSSGGKERKRDILHQGYILKDKQINRQL
jgi:hypothetical protein